MQLGLALASCAAVQSGDYGALQSIIHRFRLKFQRIEPQGQRILIIGVRDVYFSAQLHSESLHQLTAKACAILISSFAD